MNNRTVRVELETPHPRIELSLNPWNCKPSEDQSIASQQLDVRQEYETRKTDFSTGSLISYHPLLTPWSNTSSNPGVKLRRRTIHRISGFTLLLLKHQRCWRVPFKEGSRECRMLVWIFATTYISHPRSLWVTSGTPDQ
jgi:hypothetical protein